MNITKIVLLFCVLITMKSIHAEVGFGIGVGGDGVGFGVNVGGPGYVAPVYGPYGAPYPYGPYYGGPYYGGYWGDDWGYRHGRYHR